MRMIQVLQEIIFSCLGGRDVVAVVAAPCGLQDPAHPKKSGGLPPRTRPPRIWHPVRLRRLSVPWRTFRMFCIFSSVSGVVKGIGGGVRGEKGGGRTSYLEIERGGGVQRRGGRVVHTGAGRVSRGGGGKYLSFGAEIFTKVRFCGLHSWKTNKGNTGQTVLGHGPKVWFYWGSFALTDPVSKGCLVNLFSTN